MQSLLLTQLFPCSRNRKRGKLRAKKITSNDCENDDDLFITNVSGLGTLTEGPHESPRKLHQASGSTYNKLSLSAKKKSKQMNDVDGLNNEDSKCNESTSRQQSSKSRKNLSKSKSFPSGTETVNRDNHYKLRKKNTVSIVEISDSESDGNVEGDHKEMLKKLEMDAVENGTSRLKLKSRQKVCSKIDTSSVHDNGSGMTVESTPDDDDSIVIEGTDIEKSKYFNVSGKRKLSNKRLSTKLTLKKLKTSDVDEQKCSLGVNDSCESNLSDRIISNDIFRKRSHKDDEICVPANGSSLHKDFILKPTKSTGGIGDDKDNAMLNHAGVTSKIEHADNDKSVKIAYDKHIKKNKVRVEAKAVSSDKHSKNVAVDIDENSDDKDSDSEMPSSKDSVEFRVPYYLENFNMIVKTMLDDKENAKLFDKCDMMYVTRFNSLDEPTQKLYVRLFSRKLKWLPASKITYPEISDKIPLLLDDLIHAELLHSGKDLNDLLTVLKILSAPDLKLLAKSFHINCTGLTKDKIIEQLLKKSQQNSISALFKGGDKGTMEKTILTRAKSYLGEACRLRDEPRAVFIRLLMLFSLYNTNFDEESGGGGQNQLFQMLMLNIGRVTYPTYVVNRQKSIFQDRSALVRFETALQYEIDIQNTMERGKWKDAYEIYKEAKIVGEEVCCNKQYMRWDAKLPQFLRFYTAGSIYVRIDSHGVEILQRLKLYQDAVNLLEELLKQDLYCEHYRGHWYERLALNLEAHLKSVDKSFTVLKRGLADETVRTGRRLALYERARKICEAPKSKYADRLNEFNHDEVLPTPEVQIEGMVISDATSMGMKYQFVMHGDTDSVTLCAVEELVLEHYKQNGFSEGLHAEGSIISNLFVLLFWDIMFMDIPDVFQGPFQACPLDMNTRDFYMNRSHLVDDRLEWLRKSSVDELKTEISRVWKENAGKMCSGINWDKFSSPETHQNLVSCMGGTVIAGILERYVKDPRHTRSGFPDLTLWNTETKQVKICEVKGPTDRLSYKQILWIDYLLKLGVDAEVCYVKAVGSKKLKPTGKNE